MGYIVALIAAYGVWNLIGAVVALVSIMPVVSVLPYAFAKASWREWKGRHKKKAADDRRRAWEEKIESHIRQHEEMFPEANDRDENGIPYL